MGYTSLHALTIPYARSDAAYIAYFASYHGREER
jgi:hypothetical protein